MLKLKQSENSHGASKKGFAVLFAVLLASFLITLGISIFSISLKEIQIATSARDSQIAYYIADSARECTLYWDIKQGAFPTCLNSDCSISTTQITPITCNGSNIYLTFTKKDSLTYYTGINPVPNFFQASSTSLSAPIADVGIVKTFNTGTGRVVTTISAYGHNTGILGRRVERGIQQVNN